MRHRSPSCFWLYFPTLRLTRTYLKWNLSTPPLYQYCLRRQDCYMGDIGGAAQAAASITDTTITDATNIYEANKNRTFNADQANLQRQFESQMTSKQDAFNAQQAQLNRQFQAGQQVQAENYNTQMSDTAMQRRVTDLTKAGINPLLAAGNLGGASTPTMSAPSGSQASAGIPSGASASSNVMPDVRGFTQSLANLALTNAQAAKTRSETPTPQYVTVEANPDGTQSIVVNANAGHELGDQQLANQKAVVAQINSNISLNASQIDLNEALQWAKELDARVAADTMDALIKAQNSQNQLDATLANSGQRVLSTNVAGQNLGVWIEALRMVIGASKGH